jgi:hypothetical protein
MLTGDRFRFSLAACMQSSDDGEQLWHGPAIRLTTVDEVTEKDALLLGVPALSPIAVNRHAIPSGQRGALQKGVHIWTPTMAGHTTRAIFNNRRAQWLNASSWHRVPVSNASASQASFGWKTAKASDAVSSPVA